MRKRKLTVEQLVQGPYLISGLELGYPVPSLASSLREQTEVTEVIETG